MIKSFKTELFSSFVVVSLVTIIAMGIVWAGALQRKINYDYEKQATEELAEIEEAIYDHISRNEDVISGILENQIIVQSIHEQDRWLKKKAYSNLYTATENNRNTAAYYVLDENGNCVLSTTDEDYIVGRPTYWGILKVARTHPEDVIIKNASYDVSAEDGTLEMARAIMSEDECIGYVLMVSTKSHIDQLLAAHRLSGREILILDEFWHQIYSSNPDKDQTLTKLIRTRLLKGQVIKQSTDEIMINIRPMEKQGLYIVYGLRNVFDESLKRTILIIMVIISIGVFILCSILAHILSGYFMLPLNKMTEAMEKIRQGDLTVQMNLDRRDEFGMLAKDFDDMTKALKVYVDLRSKQQQELSDSNIAMMQAQLNPHFLYNTLDTIKWVAKANHIPELATLSSSLAKILRASISADIFVPLSKELELVDNYIEIQRIRFHESFSYDVELPIELEDAIIPKLILQPIVENAIVHGLRDRDNGHIFVNVYAMDQKLVIDVEDDGIGMDEEMIQTLNNRNMKALKGHIGFYNVDTIIRLHYGLNYGLTAENQITGGVRIKVGLPLRFGEEGYRSQSHVQL